eukprot:gene7154-1589_t
MHFGALASVVYQPSANEYQPGSGTARVSFCSAHEAQRAFHSAPHKFGGRVAH